MAIAIWKAPSYSPYKLKLNYKNFPEAIVDQCSKVSLEIKTIFQIGTFKIRIDLRQKYNFGIEK